MESNPTPPASHSKTHSTNIAVPQTVRLDRWRVERISGNTVASAGPLPTREVFVPAPAVALPWADWNENDWEGLWRWHTEVDLVQVPLRAELEIEGVTGSIAIRVNDIPVEEAESGFLPCVVDVAHALRAGPNTIEIIEDASWRRVPPMGSPLGATDVDFFLPAGINRPIRLRLGATQALRGIAVRSSGLLGDTPNITVTSPIPLAESEGRAIARITMNGHVVAESAVDVAAGQTEVIVTLCPEVPLELWSPECPQLHEVTLNLQACKETVASGSVRTGFRELSWERDGLRINGERRRLLGLNRHELFPYVGFAASERAQRNDARILKEDLGIDIVRCAHYPQSGAFMDACDELGLLVFEEAPGWQYAGTKERDAVYEDPWQPVPLDDRDVEFEQLHVDQIRGMIERDRHRPSVVAWGVFFNETRAFTPDLWDVVIAHAQALDPDRPLSGATRFRRAGHEKGQYDSAHDDDGHPVWPFDVFGYNDYSVDNHNEPLFDKPVDGYPYLLTEVIGQFPRFSQWFSWSSGGDALARQARYHAAAVDLAFAPGISGVIAWAAFDYQSPHGSLWGSDDPALGRRGHSLKTPGVADVFRVTKPAASVYRAQVSVEKRIVLEPAFVWDSTGTPLEIFFASNCEQLFVTVDDTPEVMIEPDHGRYPNTPHPLFPMLAPGGHAVDLRVRGTIRGQDVAALRMTRDTAGDHLEAHSDDTAILADGVDSTRVWFHVADTHGNLRTSVNGPVTIRIEGPGQLIGPNVLDSPGSVGAVWIRALPTSAGRIKLTLTHPTAGGSVVHVHARPVPPQKQEQL